QSDGKIIAGGNKYFRDLPSASANAMLVRCNPDGSIDKTFGDTGFVFTKVGNRDAVIRSVTIQDDGKILAVGYTGEYFYYDSIRNYIKLILIRYNKDGKLDYSFGNRGIAYIKISKINLYGTEVVIQPDGKILVAGSIVTQEVAGYYGAMFVARFTKNGQPDSSFYNSGHRILYFGFYANVGGMALCPDGKIIIVGESSAKQTDESEQYTIVKLTGSGELDAEFGKNGKVITHLLNTYPHFVNCMVVQADGKIILGAQGYNNLTTDDFTIIRFTSTGIIDSTFGKNGISYIDFGYEESPASLVIQPDGKIIAAGYSDVIGGSQNEFYILARINQSGLLDSSFNHNGKLTTFFSNKDQARAQKVLLQPDGKIIAVGFADKLYSRAYVPVITRYLGDGPGIIASAKQPAKTDPIKVFPNPATTLVQVTGLQKNMPTELIITDRTGNVLKKTTTTNDSFSWNIADLRNGYYYLIIQNNNLTHSVLLLKQ
ncbi:MAG: T9SS type A sorting domain-containing protein, partial [Chitinophagaceae bacterium]